jgi:hypothetical protein
MRIPLVQQVVRPSYSPRDSGLCRKNVSTIEMEMSRWTSVLPAFAAVMQPACRQIEPVHQSELIGRAMGGGNGRSNPCQFGAGSPAISGID